MLSGDLETARRSCAITSRRRSVLKKLAAATDTPPKSLIRMFGRRGNPQARNLFSVIGYLQKRAGVRTARRRIVVVARMSAATCGVMRGGKPRISLRSSGLRSTGQAMRPKMLGLSGKNDGYRFAPPILRTRQTERPIHQRSGALKIEITIQMLLGHERRPAVEFLILRVAAARYLRHSRPRRLLHPYMPPAARHRTRRAVAPSGRHHPMCTSCWSSRHASQFRKKFASFPVQV